jgi:hypothetical protein
MSPGLFSFARAQVIHGIQQALLERMLAIDAHGNLQHVDEPEEEQARAKFRSAKANVAKRALKRSRYTLWKQQGAAVLAKAYGMSAFQVGDNLQASYKKHEPEDPTESPEALAAMLVRGPRRPLAP